MQDKESKLPEITEESFDGERYSTEVKHEKCKHDVELKDDKLICKKCHIGWQGPQIHRLFQAFQNEKR